MRAAVAAQHLPPKSPRYRLSSRARFLRTQAAMGTSVSSSPPPESQLHRRRILVCLDRSKFSEVCVPYAVALAKTFGSAVTLMHVMQLHAEQAGQQTHDALSWEISRQEAQGYLERFQKELSPSLPQPVDLRLEQGHPAERIVDLAREIGADLTVLGSHGEAGVTPWNLGSTVQQVLAVTRSSVLIVHSSAAAPADMRLKRILVPLDGSLRTESVLPAVARMAMAQSAEILLVHVVNEPLPTALHAAEDIDLARKLASHLESAAQRYLERLRERLSHDGAIVRAAVVRHANERECLLEISQREGADLIVLSAHGSACASTRPFGTVATYLLTHSMVPLLVLQDLPECEPNRAQHVNPKVASASLRASYAPETA
jgi:nucleotide-binding universal stress UspA family protein